MGAVEEAVSRRRWPDLLAFRRLGLILLALGVAVVVPLVALLRGGGDAASAVAPVAPRSIAVIDPESERVVDSVRLVSSPSSVLAAGGAVWVASAADRTLMRIDPTSRTVEKRIGLGFRPDALADGGSIIWVAGGTSSPHVLLPVVAASNEALESVAVDGAYGVVILAADADDVWIGDNEDYRISRIDPRTGEKLDEICCTITAEAIGLDGTTLWAVERYDRTIDRIDTRTSEVQTIPFGAPPVRSGVFTTFHEPISAIAVGEGGVWITDSIEGKVWRVDPVSTLIAETIRVRAGALAIAIGAGAVWVANSSDGTVSKIDPETNRVVGTLKVGGHVEGIAASDEAVWVAVP